MRLLPVHREDKMNLFTSNYKILSSDCDRHGIWKMNRILVLLQELSGEHSDLLGLSFEETLALGAVWVVTRNEFEVLRYPAISQTVVGKTFPGRARRGIYPRYYLIEDLQGRPLVRASSFWALADVTTRQMTDIPEVQSRMPDTSGLTPFFHNPAAADELAQGLRRQALWQPVYTDLDRNGHVNNTRAADWALCFLSEAADLQAHPVRRVLASYHHEIMQGDMVSMHFACDCPDFSLRCDVGDNLALRLSGSLFDQAPVPGD